jgi:hypothetical protein
MQPGEVGRFPDPDGEMGGRMKTLCVTILGAATLLLALASSSANADSFAYDGVVNLSAEARDVRVEHGHDWSNATNDARWKMISTTKDPFSAENNYSYLQLREKAAGTVLFRRPVPALSHIWISPDAKYVVGISNIKIWNPYQLVVYSRSGDRLLELDLVDMTLRGATQSVTNWIHWYKEPEPRIAIVENGATATLYVEDRLGGFHQFQFAAISK